MNGNTLWIKSILLSCSLLFAFTHANDVMAAAAATATTAKAQAVTPGKSKISKSHLHVQNYHGKGLNVEFRYVNGKMKSMVVMNTTKYPIKVETLNNRYILGSGDYVEIDPPSVDLIHIKQTKLHGDDSLMDILFPDRFSYYMTFSLPSPREDKRVSITESE